jgi:iron complex transport system ATP-binding protein
VRDLSHARSLATVITVHDLALAARVADRIAIMEGGRIVADGPALDVLTPERLLQAFGVPASLVVFEDGPPALRLPGCRHAEGGQDSPRLTPSPALPAGRRPIA